MSLKKKSLALVTIAENIKKYGYHIYVITGNSTPRYVYTIGLLNILGCELIIPGCSNFELNDIKNIIDTAAHIAQNIDVFNEAEFEIENYGKFKLTEVHFSWEKRLVDGAYDFFGKNKIALFQIVPVRKKLTIDTPDMHLEWVEDAFPAWRWLDGSCELLLPKQAHAITNLLVLYGEDITEVNRWEVDQWELFSGAAKDVLKDDARILPLRVLLSIDKTLSDVISLKIGGGLWRENKSAKWHPLDE